MERTGKSASSSTRICLCDLFDRSSSLTIHRVESALPLERAEMRTVPAAIIDCVTKLQLLNAAREGSQQKVMKNGNNANTQSGQLRLTAVLDDLLFPRGQSYRVKRLSACGGCLGDYRR